MSDVLSSSGSSPSSVACPHCGQMYSVTPEQRAQYGSQPITCTRCQRPFTADGAPVVATAMGGPVGYAPAGEYFTPPAKASGWSVASLVFGCLSFFIPIVAPLAAVVTGIVGLVKANRPGVGGRGFAIAGLVLGLTGFFISTMLIAILLPSLNRAREQANRIKCASNLRQVGQAIQIYANENKGQFPDTIDQLMLTGDLGPEALVCPTSNDTIAPGTTPHEHVASLATPGHLSYVYVGKGLTYRAGADVVVAYEPPANHRNDGMNVLYADGHVDWVGRNVAPKVISELEAGQNPPPSDAGN